MGSISLRVVDDIVSDGGDLFKFGAVLDWQIMGECI